MKKLIGILTIAIAAFIAAPQAEAHGHRGPGRYYVEYHRDCRGPAWVETYIAYYDHCGHPVFRTRVVPARPRYCPPPRRAVRFQVNYGHGHCR